MPAHAFLHRLARHRSIDPVLCHAGQDQAGKLRLVGYLAFRDATAPTQQALRADAGQLLAQKADVVSV
ncbi:hypothetical protein ACWYXK_02240 [Janthinobacterium lividum]